MIFFRSIAELDSFDASLREKIVLQTAKEEGQQKGKLEGIIEGENNKEYAIARKMLAKNKSIEEIIELTELTAEQIENLKN